MRWLAGRYAFNSRALVEAGIATFRRRGEHSWLPTPAPPPAAWARQYTALRREMHLSPVTPLAAYEALLHFLAPVPASDTTPRWSPTTATWVHWLMVEDDEGKSR